jgi:hypothetical protein
MASSEIVSLKIEVARHRCEGLTRETKQLKNKDYSSRGSNILIEFVEKATGSVLAYLQKEETLPDKDLLAEDELEDRIHRVSKLLPFLHYLLGFVEGSEIGVAPVPLVLQLRRLAGDIIPGSEVAISARPDLNYSILEVASVVRAVLNQTPLKDCCDVLPSSLFVVTIPRAESTDVLLHCILSHELGHGLYEKHGLAAKILPKIEIDQKSVKGLASAIVSQLPGTAPPLFEVELRNIITQQVTGRISKWTQELCSDAFGIELFGPAYYFSFIYFSLAFAHLDKESATHPPHRLRLKLMARILRRLYPESCFKPTVRKFIEYWESLSIKAIPIKDAIARIEPLLINVIPPGEDFSEGQYKPTEMSSILNVGWDVMLSELPALSANLPKQETASSYQLRQKLQKLLVKALEISDTKLSWEEKRNAAGL